MATPPTRVTSVVPATGNYTTTTSPKVTAALPALFVGDIIVVVAGSEQAGTNAVVNPVASAGSVTWTLQTSQMTGTTNQSGEKLWTGVVGAAAAAGATISLARINTGTTLWWGFSATVWRDHGGVGQPFAGSSGTASSVAQLTTPALAANSGVQVGINDWNASTIATPSWQTVNGSAMTTSLNVTGASHATAVGGYRTDVGAAGTKVVGLTTPATLRWVMVGVEILGTSSAGSTTGSGAAAATAATASGAGTSTVTGSGAASSAAATTQGSATVRATGSGAAAAQAGSASGAGTVTQPSTTGSGSASATPATASGAGSSTTTGQGSTSASPASASGAGSASVTGSGSAASSASSATGSGTARTTGAGSATAAPGVALGTTGTPTASGSGGAEPAPGTASGAGIARSEGSGAASSVASTAKATGGLSIAGSGSASATPATTDGTGLVVNPGAYEDLTVTITLAERPTVARLAFRPATVTLGAPAARATAALGTRRTTATLEEQ